MVTLLSRRPFRAASAGTVSTFATGMMNPGGVAFRA
jgi:hypothetical protein